MNSVVEISGFAGLVMLAVPLLMLTIALVSALFWPFLVSPVPLDTATAPELVPGGGRPPLERDKTEARGHGDRAEQEPDIFQTPNVIAPKSNGLAREEIEARPLALPDVADLDPRAAQAHEFLTEALSFRDAGDDDSAAESLRKTIMLATSIRNDRLHARARLELGDIAEAQGDLTTACEHWQLARSLFEDERRTNDASHCEARMARNGCPTDWVLTDF
jgi:soluble NSF attachment protein (SNAP)-like